MTTHSFNNAREHRRPAFALTADQLDEAFRFEVEQAKFLDSANPIGFALARFRIMHHFSLVNLFGEMPSDQELLHKFFDDAPGSAADEISQ